MLMRVKNGIVCAMSMCVVWTAWLALSAPAQAVWSADPALNFQITSAIGRQVQPKICVTPDGGMYVSWLDGASGFDVRLQRMNAAGDPLWASGGVLIANRSLSATQDYGLSVDAAGHALLTFRDDRFGGVLITASRVAPNGVLDWGPNGVQLTAGVSFVAAPKIVGASDGSIVVAWTNNNVVLINSLDSNGGILWVSTLADAAGLNFTASDLQASDAPGHTGEVILLLVQSGSFSAPRHLQIQKFNGTGAGVWGAVPIVVFNTGSLQFGSFPTFVPDGTGGAAISWDQRSPALQTYAQRIRADGSIELPANGLPLSTNALRLRSSPSVAYDPASQTLYSFWVETNSLQSLFGLYGQKVAAGARQWGAEGAAIIPLQSQELTQVRTLTLGGEAMVFFTQASSFSHQQIHGFRFDAGAATVWANDVTTVAFSGVSRTQTALSGSQVFFVWEDTRNDAGDLYGQNVNSDGTLGAVTTPSDLNGDGVVDAADLATLLAQWGSVGNADLNADGVVNAADLASLLANWG